MKAGLFALFLCASLNVYATDSGVAEGVIKITPENFTKDIVSLVEKDSAGSIPENLWSVLPDGISGLLTGTKVTQIQGEKDTEVLALSEDVRIIAQKTDKGDALKSIRVSCSRVVTFRSRLHYCLIGMFVSTDPIELSQLYTVDISNLADKIQEMLIDGKPAVYRESGLNYEISADWHQRTMQMLITADAPQTGRKPTMRMRNMK